MLLPEPVVPLHRSANEGIQVQSMMGQEEDETRLGMAFDQGWKGGSIDSS